VQVQVDKADKVKKTPTSYNCYMKAQLSIYKEANPDINHQEAFKVVAGGWKKLSGADQASYKVAA